VRTLGLALISGAIIASCVLIVPVAWAEDIETKKACDSRGCYVISKSQTKPPRKARRDDGSSSPGRGANDQNEANERVSDTRKKFSAALAAYDRRLAIYTRCVQTFDPSLNNAGCGNPPTPPTPPEFGSDTFSGRGNRPPITAGQAAAIAVARLKLPTIAPGIGPSPELNPWNMAAVGYPLWLWADGPTHVSVRSTHENRQGQSRHLRQDFV
jgi:hypothetical protein